MNGTGYAAKTSDGVVGPSGVPVTIFAINVIDDGSASTVKLYDGTTAGGTLVIQLTTTAGVATNLKVGGERGIVFAGGCFCDVDSHTTVATVAYEVAK